MSLTNDQITAQNFKAFYDEIRPYLNGQIPTFANSFSRSDLYSTDEKIIGCWTDGKPLYQKTFLNFAPTNTVLIENVDTVVNWSCLRNLSGTDTNWYQIADGNENTNDLSVKIDNHNLKLVPPGSYYNAGNVVHATFQYTKTTDTAIKVGTGNDYSTDEQIVGTDIDGNYVYQITGVFTNPTLNTRISLSSIVPNNADAVRVTEAYGVRANDNVSLYAKSNSDLFQAWVNHYSEYDHWDLLISSNEAVNKAVITFRYTKTV